MSGSGKGLLGLWLYRSGEQEWAVKEGSPLHKEDENLLVNKNRFLVSILVFGHEGHSGTECVLVWHFHHTLK